jgi:hypothetical protein
MTSWFPFSCLFPPFFRAGRCFPVLGGCRGLGPSRFSCLAFPLGGGGGVLGMRASLPLFRALVAVRVGHQRGSVVLLLGDVVVL